MKKISETSSYIIISVEVIRVLEKQYSLNKSRMKKYFPVRIVSQFEKAFKLRWITCNGRELLLVVGNCLQYNKGVSKGNQITINHETRT